MKTRIRMGLVSPQMDCRLHAAAYAPQAAHAPAAASRKNWHLDPASDPPESIATAKRTQEVIENEHSRP
jgi:hypothetical protein